MTFLEAHRLVTGFSGGTSKALRIALSGVGDPLAIYLKAAATRHGIALEPQFLPFNTLHQHLLSPADGQTEVFLLLPWDLAPELDWRSGVPRTIDEAAVIDRARQIAASIARRHARVVYLPAPVPPVLPDAARLRALAFDLRAVAAAVGAVEAPADVFSLPSYFATGLAIAGGSLGAVGQMLIAAAFTSKPEPAKVVVTDLDNVMWDGVIAEDGLEGIHYGPLGAGYKHFVYQTLLARLKSEGILLAAVSRNDPEVARLPFQQGSMTLREDDFVSIVASYHAKSAQVAALAERLNLGLDAFVFVDDNEIELAEMHLELPGVRCEPFPKRDEDLPRALERISAHFDRPVITAEDRERTEMYRRRLAGMAPSDAQGGDLRAFLTGLDMSLALHDRSSGDRARAVQLINKTSQFNINGRRVTDEEVAAVLDAGGRLLTATLDDRNGTHGEILSILIDSDDVVRSFVMSCRVFNRRVEYAFLGSLARAARPPRVFEVATTSRNEPARTFLRSDAFSPDGDDRLRFDAERFLAEFGDDASLFRLVER
ncbi:MAG: HAD-IIIC family phosphatase [Acidobacteria bacterium]|nr:HAD-IIIC family phosphatase [Acidobacteriota bacterium]